MTDDRLPPFGPDDRAVPPEQAEPRALLNPDGHSASEGTGGAAAHPDTEKLSAYLDRALTLHETTGVTHHLGECPACSRRLGLLRTARRVLSSAGHPRPPSGARESAVAAALASVDLAGAEKEGAFDRELAAASDAVVDVPAGRQPRAGSRRRAIRRQRHAEALTRAAVIVLCLGAVGGGLYGVIRSSHGGTSASAMREASLGKAAHNAAGTSHPKGAVNPNELVKQPPRGTLALELRPRTGPAPCSELRRQTLSVEGSPVVVNPAAGKAAVMQVPIAAGQPRTCIGVGPAFAIAWSADVSQVTIRAISGSGTPAGGAVSTVDLAVALAPDAVTEPAILQEALKGMLTVEVIAQGVDLGTATITKGPVVTFAVSRLLATFLHLRLVDHTGRTG